MDQSDLARRVGLGKSTINRILKGTQEPKLSVAYELAKALGVSLDYLVEESVDVSSGPYSAMLSQEELTILRIARELGHDIAIKRLVNAPNPPRTS